MILHVCSLDKFIFPYFEFVKENFKDFKSRHYFYIRGKSDVYKMPEGENIYISEKGKFLERYISLISSMKKADKIILHGLADIRIVLLLAAQPWLLRKCYWAIWGIDLYTYQLNKRNFRWWRNELIRRFVIKRIGHFITHIKGDYELARHWYGAKGQWHECFMYPSNLYQELNFQTFRKEGVNILVGNSADPSNNHIEVLRKLMCHVKDNIKIYCPLSYGDQENADKVMSYGTSMFGEKFIGMREFIKFEKYIEFLAKIDVAVFNHKRQQGMGNTITLIGMEKKVYMREDVTPYAMLKNLGISVYPIDDLSLDEMNRSDSRRNKEIVKKYFSKTKLVSQWSKIYE